MNREMQRCHSSKQFRALYEKCLWTVLLLELIDQTVYEKYIEVGDMVTSADVICITTYVYNLDRQFNIMHILSVTAIADTAVQNPSVSELHVVKAGHNKKGPATEERISSNTINT